MRRLHPPHRRRAWPPCSASSACRRSTSSSTSCPTALRLAGGLGLGRRARPSPTSSPAWRTWPRANRPCGRDLVCFAGGGAYDHEVPAGDPGPGRRVRSSSPPTRPTSPRWPRACCRPSSSSRRWWPGLTGLRGGQRLALRRGGRRWSRRSTSVSPPRADARCGCRTASTPLARGARTLRRGHRAPDRGRAALGRVHRLGGRPPSTTARRRGCSWSAYPNYLGCLEDLAAARAVCDRTGALLVVAFDPVCAGVLRSPGDWGADVVVGEGQALGMPLSFGGPVPRPVRLHPGPRPPAAGPPRGRDGRRRGTSGLRHHAARPRAGHPTGEGHLQRVHEPDPHGGHRRHPTRLAGHHGPGRGGAALAPAGRTTAARGCSGVPGVEPLVGGPDAA